MEGTNRMSVYTTQMIQVQLTLPFAYSFPNGENSRCRLKGEVCEAQVGPVEKYILSYHVFTFAYMAPFKARSLYFPTKAQHVRKMLSKNWRLAKMQMQIWICGQTYTV